MYHKPLELTAGLISGSHLACLVKSHAADTPLSFFYKPLVAGTGFLRVVPAALEAAPGKSVISRFFDLLLQAGEPFRSLEVLESRR